MNSSTDLRSVGRVDMTKLSVEALRAELARVEARLTTSVVAAEAMMGGYLVGFSTALTDDDRWYLDVQAELHARAERGEEPCAEDQQQ